MPPLTVRFIDPDAIPKQDTLVWVDETVSELHACEYTRGSNERGIKKSKMNFPMLLGTKILLEWYKQQLVFCRLDMFIADDFNN